MQSIVLQVNCAANSIRFTSYLWCLRPVCLNFEPEQVLHLLQTMQSSEASACVDLLAVHYVVNIFQGILL